MIEQHLARIKQWYPEDDPITCSQIETLLNILDDQPLSEAALEGFLVVCSRMVDTYGNHRTNKLAKVFRTDQPAGKRPLLASLEHINRWVGGMDGYLKHYPVTIIPPRPAFPQFKIIGIEKIADLLYRVIDSQSRVYSTQEPIIAYIQRTGRLPAVPKQRRPVRRSKPRYHWCSYEALDAPDATREAMQILDGWSDCRLRATIRTTNIRGSAYVAFNGDRIDPNDECLRFYGYYFEPLAEDHPPQLGGGTQIGLEGSPRIECLERWHDARHCWERI